MKFLTDFVFVDRVTFPDGKVAFTGCDSDLSFYAKRNKLKVDRVKVTPPCPVVGFSLDDFDSRYRANGVPVDPSMLLTPKERSSRFEQLATKPTGKPMGC